MCAAALWKCCGMIPSPTSWTLPAAWAPQELRILLLEGANKGTEVTIANYLTRTQNVRLRQGRNRHYL